MQKFILLLLLASCAEPGNGISLGELLSVEIFTGSLIDGFAEGQGTAVRFNEPVGITVAPGGNIYVADVKNHRIRKITSAGSVSTLVIRTQGTDKGLVATTRFNQPFGITMAPDGNIYFADPYNHRIHKITPSGLVSTFTGSGKPCSANGLGTALQFNFPTGIAVGPNGNIYVTDSTYKSRAILNRIRKISPTGCVTTLSTSTQDMIIRGIAVGPKGNIYVTEYHRILKITPTGSVSVLAGNTEGFADGQGTAAQFNFPTGIAVGPDGNIYVADTRNNRICRISPSGEVSTIIKDLNYPQGISVTSDVAYITDSHRIIRARFR